MSNPSEMMTRLNDEWDATSKENKVKQEFYVAVRRAGSDFIDESIKKGEEYFDSSSLAHSEGTSKGMAESHGRMVSTSSYDHNKKCPIVRIARVNIVEID